MSCPLFPSRVAPQAVTVTVVGQFAGTLTLNWHLPCQWRSHWQMCARTDGHQRRSLTRSLAAWATVGRVRLGRALLVVRPPSRGSECFYPGRHVPAHRWCPAANRDRTVGICTERLSAPRRDGYFQIYPSRHRLRRCPYLPCGNVRRAPQRHADRVEGPIWAQQGARAVSHR